LAPCARAAPHEICIDAVDVDKRIEREWERNDSARDTAAAAAAAAGEEVRRCGGTWQFTEASVKLRKK
jgi:hypothetical protein